MFYILVYVVYFILLNTLVYTIYILIIAYYIHFIQQNMFTVCNEMQNITVSRVTTAINASVFTGLVLYLILAGVGYSTFGSLVANDILVSYPSEYL